MRYKMLASDRVLSDGTPLYRIKALQSFTCYGGRQVNVGDVGGYVQSRENLSDVTGSKAWVFDEAVVRGNAEVLGDACVYDTSQVADNAKIVHNAAIHDNVTVMEDALVSDRACIRDNVIVRGNARVLEDALVADDVIIKDSATVKGYARILAETVLGGYTYVKDNARISMNRDNINLGIFQGYSVVTSLEDYMIVGPIGSRMDDVIFTKDRGTVYAATGCYYDTLDEFIAQVRWVHELDKETLDCYEAAVALVKVRFAQFLNKE